MYPTYSLQVYDYIQNKWVADSGSEASNRPHHYDVLRKRFERLVGGAKNGSPSQAPIGYRIVRHTPAGIAEIDRWDNGKVAK